MLVSIVIPYRNPGDLLGQSLRSAFAQTRAEVEILAINAGSSDGSDCLAKALRDPRVRHLQADGSEENAARNLGIREARGEFLQFLDATDVLHPDKVRRQLEVAARAGEKALTVSSLQVFRDLDPPEDGEYRAVDTPSENPLLFLLAALASGSDPHPIRIGQLLISRHLLESTGAFQLPLGEDAELEYITRACLAADEIRACPEALTYRRELRKWNPARLEGLRERLSRSMSATDATIAHLQSHPEAPGCQAQLEAAADNLYQHLYRAAWPACPSVYREAHRRLRAIGSSTRALPAEERKGHRADNSQPWRRHAMRSFAREVARTLEHRLFGDQVSEPLSAWRYRPPNSTSHVELIDAWNRVLPIATHSIEDTFEECGGDPLLAARLIDEVTVATGLRIPTVRPGDTVETLAWQLLHEWSQQTREDIRTVETPATSAGIPIVFFHGEVNGGTGWVDRFASRLAESRRVHVVETPDVVRDPEIAFSSMERRISPVLPALEEIVGDRPVLFAGYCHGANMAFEAAHYFRHRGVQVPGVIVLDIGLANSAMRSLREPWKKWARLVGMDDVTRTRKLADLHVAKQVWTIRLQALLGQRSDFLGMQKGQQARFRNPLFSRIRRYLGMRFDATKTGVWGSIPLAFDGRVVHVLAQQYKIWWPTGPRKSWRSCAGDFVALRSPGDHATLVTRHQEELLAGILPELDRFDREIRATLTESA